MDIEKYDLKKDDQIHAEIVAGTRTFILCYVDRPVPNAQPFYARMFFN